jgi:hypothetical protein
MPPVGFEPTIPASARPQTYVLDRAATGIGYTEGTKEFEFRWFQTIYNAGGTWTCLTGFVPTACCSPVLTY